MDRVGSHPYSDWDWKWELSCLIDSPCSLDVVCSLPLAEYQEICEESSIHLIQASFSDVVSSRFFVVPSYRFRDSCEPPIGGTCIFEVDFFSRHTLIRPSASLEDKPWLLSDGGQCYVLDKEKFFAEMMTSEMFFALPQHRFRQLVDDVNEHASEITYSPYQVDRLYSLEALTAVLRSKRIGYTFTLFYHEDGDMYAAPALVHACLEGTVYEDARVCRLAPKHILR